MKIFGLIGFPLGHSFSKSIFDKKIAESGLNAKFQNFELPDINLFPSLLSNNIGLAGIAVTIPYKKTVIPYLEELDLSASETGAVNCIKFLKGKSIGYNTDAAGFKKSFDLIKSEKKRCLVLGTGGASNAVRYILKNENADYLTVSRSNDKNFIPYSNINSQLLKNFPIVINCTPLGMFPNIYSLPPLPYKYLTTENILFDLVYNPQVTAFMKEGILRGCIVKNGLEMLNFQADENWKIWTSAV